GEQPLDGDDRPGGVVGHVEVAGEVDAVEVGVVGAAEPPVEPALDGGVGDVEVVQGEDVDPAAGGGVVQAGGGELDRDAQRPLVGGLQAVVLAGAGAGEQVGLGDALRQPHERVPHHERVQPVPAAAARLDAGGVDGHRDREQGVGVDVEVGEAGVGGEPLDSL